MARKPKELEAVIRIGGQMDATVQKAIRKTTDAINGVGVKFAKIEKAAALAGAAMAAAFVGAAAAMGKTALNSAIDFEKQMSNVATLLDGNVTKRVGELNDEVLRVSKETGTATSDLTDGLYQVISAFGDSAESIKIMDTAARAAVAGNATTTDAINLLSAVTKGYGDTSAEANARAADLAFTTVKLGQTSFPELAAAMGRVIPLASTMGIKQEELFGAMATLTGVTGSTAEVVTQLRGAVQGFLQPTDSMTQVMKKLGFANGKVMLDALGLEKSLVVLRKAVGNNEVAFSSLFGSIEAKNAVLALTGAQLDAFREKTAAMYGEANGATARAFAAQTNNISGLANKLKAYWNVTMIEIGKSLLPVVEEMFEKALPKMQAAMDQFKVIVTQNVTALRAWAASVDWRALAQKFMAAMATIKNALATVYSFAEQNKGALIMAGKALAAIWAAFHAVSLAVKAFAACKAVIITVGAVFSALASTVGIVVVAIAAVGVAAWALYEYWDEVCAACSKAWAWLCGKLQESWTTFSAKYKTTAKLLAAAWDILCAGIKLAIGHIAFSWKTFCEVIQIAWQGFMAFIVPAWDTVKLAWDILCNAFSTGFGTAMKAIETAINVAWSVIKGVIALFMGDWDSACIHFENAIGAVGDFWKTVWDNVTSHLEFTVEKIKGIAGLIKSAFFAAWDAIKDRVRSVVESIMSYLSPIIAKVKWVIDKLPGAVADAVSNPTEKFAAGGFTTGPSICGEAGTEAVISFDPAYRKENQGYLMTAAEMLGMTTAPASSGSTTYNMGGVTFSPVVKVGENANAGDIMRKLRACVPELVDLIEEAMNERASHRYA